MDYGLNLKSAIELCTLMLQNQVPLIEIDRSTMRSRCACLKDCNVCESCQLFIKSNDLSICKRAIKLLEEKEVQLNSLGWLDEE
jgi:hypothetical protein